MCFRRNNPCMQCYVWIKCETPFYFKAICSEKIQQLCAATTLYTNWGKKLSPSDIIKRIKEITDASKINKQLTGYPRNISNNYRGKINFRGRNNTVPTLVEAAKDGLEACQKIKLRTRPRLQIPTEFLDAGFYWPC